MTEEGFTVNKVPNLDKEADIEEIGKNLNLERRRKNNWRVRIYI